MNGLMVWISLYAWIYGTVGEVLAPAKDSNTLSLEQLRTEYQQQLTTCQGMYGWIMPRPVGAKGQVMLQLAEKHHVEDGAQHTIWRPQKQLVPLAGSLLAELGKLSRSLVCLQGQQVDSVYQVKDYQLMQLRDRFAMVGQVQLDGQQHMIWFHRQIPLQLHQAVSVRQLLDKGCQPKIWFIPERLVFPVLHLGSYGIIAENCPIKQNMPDPTERMNHNVKDKEQQDEQAPKLHGVRPQFTDK